MTSTRSPLKRFTERLVSFAEGQKRGIRNPFVIVPVKPRLEARVGSYLRDWAENDGPNGLPVHVLDLDELLPQTEVYRISTVVTPSALGQGEAVWDTIEQTMQDSLAEQLVDQIRETVPNPSESKQILILLGLGALHPFTRASELLDELDRTGVRATVGLPFPGEVIGGKLSFFGEDARHYYPAHRINGQVKEAHLP